MTHPRSERPETERLGGCGLNRVPHLVIGVLAFGGSYSDHQGTCEGRLAGGNAHRHDQQARRAQIKSERWVGSMTISAEVRQAARLLSEQGMSLRDVGAALGVSYQRAHQLLSS